MGLKLRFRPISLILFSLLFSFNVYSEDCLSLIKTLLPKLDSEVAKTIDIEDHLNHRKFIAQFAKKNDIPVFIKQNDRGVEVPVILVNRKTAPKLKGLFENSFGTQVVLQADWKNDHGLLRSGKYIIDVDTPGARGYGEIEYTGIAWKDIDSYLPRREVNSYPVLEVTYLLTPNEKIVIDYYQKIRRSAIFRVKFTFGGGDNANYPNLLQNGGEHCFIFCKGSAINSQISEIRSRLVKIGAQDPDALLANPDVIKKLATIREVVNEVQPNELHHDLLNSDGMLELLDGHYPAEVATRVQKLDFLNWLVSYDSSKQYASTLRELGVSSDMGVRDAINQRASAIFIYDEGAQAAAFKNATYSTNGKMISWPNGKQYPVD